MSGLKLERIEGGRPVPAGILAMSPRRRWAVTAGVMSGMFLAALEATVVSTAMPTIIASLGGLAHFSWVFSAYLITSTVTVPVWGKLSDLYGRRRLYQVGIGVFLLGSVLSGLSQSMGQLVASRAVQGLGAGALVTLSMTIIADIYTVEERTRMQGFFSGVWGVASILGPVVGGFITDQLSWRWVFFINVPVGTAAAVLIGMSLLDPLRAARPRIDYAGALLLMLSMTILMIGLIEGGEGLAGLMAPRNLLLLAAAAALAGAFAFVERRVPDPIVPFRLFRNRVVAVSVTAGFLAGVAMFGAISFIPLYAQGTLGATATEAGSLLTPLMLSWVTLSVIGGRLLLRIGYRSTSLLGFLLLTLGFLLLSTFQPESARVWLYVDLAVIGAGLGLSMLTLLIAVQQSVARTELGIATSLNQFSRSIGGALGVAVMGVVLSAGLSSSLQEGVRNGALDADLARELSRNPSALIETDAALRLPPNALPILQEGLNSAVHSVFWIGTAAAALAFLVVLRLPRQRPPAV
jgi:EmrB/QacA subfamily drug resistance transporter